jgi:transposase
MLWIGVDAHKRVHQAVARGGDGELSQRTIGNTPEGWASLLVWAQQ